MKTYSRKKADDHEEVIIDLNELCRLCMCKDEELISVFENCEGVPLPLRIMACSSLEVTENDGLPNKICQSCKLQLEKFYLFRKKCEISDSKLRQHVKSLMAKLGDESDDEQVCELLPEGDSMQEVQLSSEQELVGVAQVAYINPDADNDEDPVDITLKVDEELTNRDACTLDEEVKAKKQEDQEFYALAEDQQVFAIDAQREPVLEDQDLDFIAEAVKNTLASHPNLNLTGDLQMKVEQVLGKPTQVSVTTDDGSVIVMELTNEEMEAAQTSSVDEEEGVTEDGELKVFQCPDCPKSFARRIQLRRHSSVHMKQRGFSCGICEKWFPTRSALVRHERIHTGERPFQCEVCQRSFAQKEILFRHLMTHSGMKPFDCPHCGKGFSQKESLRAHLKIHMSVAGEVNQQMFHYCTLCPKVFCHASGLSRHLVTHTGKTFKCRTCDKKFNDKSSMRRHIKQCNQE